MNVFENIRVSQIDSVVLIENAAEQTRRINNRFAYAISFCISGQITYHFEGKDYVSSPDRVIFIPMGKTYTVTCEKSGIFPLINFYCCEDISEYGFCSLGLERNEYYLKAFESLRKSFSLHNTTRDIRCLAAFYDILSHIAGETVNSDSLILKGAMQYLEANYSDPALNNQVLADIANISEVYFRKLFSKVYSLPPGKYIQQLRISKAKELLKDNSMSISQISENCGYTSVYHFSRAFKASVGQSPGQYRKSFASTLF